MLQTVTGEATIEHERRAYKRVELHVPGQLFDPATEQTVQCRVLNMSAGGAGLECQPAIVEGRRLVLYIEGFGRFEGSVLPCVPEKPNYLRLLFSLSEAKRGRVTEMLSLFVREGFSGMTTLRVARRRRTNGMVQLVLAGGQSHACELIDISLDGVSLKTEMRPAVGEIVTVGDTKARVARHHENGLGLQFVKYQPE